MLKRIFVPLICFALFFITGSVFSADSNSSAVYIQRTMKALTESTAEHPANVRVLFYGQSIVAQAWTQQVQQYLQKTYPTVKFTFLNRAIGGYTSPVLIRTAESDLYPWYPDLLFFHVYGDLKKYEEIIRNVRVRTSAEIIVWTSHLSANQDPEAFTKNRDERSQGILEVAKRNKCMVIDLNAKWCKLLLEKKWKAQELLADGIHLKPQGCDYYAQFIIEELVRVPEQSGDETVSGSITRIDLTDSAVQKKANGDISLTFTGNRVSVHSNGQGDKNVEATLLLDGQPMGGNKALWAFTRPSCGPKWMPAINAIESDVPWIKEDWTLTALPDSKEDGSLIHYKVTGSVTGEDGDGWSDKDFVSKSGRIKIKSNDFAAPGQFKYFKVPLSKDFKVKWSTYPLFTEIYRPTPAGTSTVLVQNCSNESHVLTIQTKNGNLGIDGFIVNTPAKAK